MFLKKIQLYIFSLLVGTLSAQNFDHIAYTQRNYSVVETSNPLGLNFQSVFSQDLNLGYNYNKNFQLKTLDTLYNKIAQTDVHYFAGAVRQQSIDVRHEQKLSKQVGLHVFFENSNATGDYQEEQAGQSNIDLHLYAKDSLNRKFIHFNYFSNRKTFQQNGGINQGTLSFVEAIDIKRNVSTRLSAQRIDRFRSFVLKTGLNLSETKQISLKFEHDRQLAKYNDESVGFDTSYYNNYNILTYGLVNDSIFIKKYRLSAIINNPFLIDSSLYYTFSLQQAFFTQTQHYKDSVQIDYINALDNSSNNLILGLSANYLNKAYFKGYYNLLGFNQNDYHLSFSYHLKKFGLALQFDQNQKRAHEIFYRNSSPYLNYSNALKKVQTSRFALEFNKFSFLSVNLEAYQLANQPYFDENITVQQIASTSVLKADLNLKKEYKSFLLIGSLLLQQADERLNLAQLSSSLELYYNFALFKKTLPMTLGLICNYRPEQYLPTYLPLLDAQHYQNQILSGGLPVVDFYTDIHLTNASLYVRVVHASNGFFSQGVVASTTYYPYADRQIYFGVKWRFLN